MEEEPKSEQEAFFDKVEDILGELFPAAVRAGSLRRKADKVELYINKLEITVWGEWDMHVKLNGADCPEMYQVKQGNALAWIRAFHQRMLPFARAMVAAAGPEEVSDG
jgi:hypothetical protein